MLSKNMANCFNNEYDSVIESNFFKQVMNSFNQAMNSIQKVTNLSPKVMRLWMELRPNSVAVFSKSSLQELRSPTREPMMSWAPLWLLQ